MNNEILKKIEDITKPILESKNFDLVDIEYHTSNEGKILKIYIDKEGGVSLKDCEDVSIVLSAVLDSYDFIKEQYFLEVSSPGIYRELKKEKDYIRYLGHRIKIKFYEPISEIKGQKVLIGILKSYNDGFLTISLDNGEELKFDLKKIAKVNLEPNISDFL